MSRRPWRASIAGLQVDELVAGARAQQQRLVEQVGDLKGDVAHVSGPELVVFATASVVRDTAAFKSILGK